MNVTTGYVVSLSSSHFSFHTGCLDKVHLNLYKASNLANHSTLRKTSIVWNKHDMH